MPQGKVIQEHQNFPRRKALFCNLKQFYLFLTQLREQSPLPHESFRVAARENCSSNNDFLPSDLLYLFAHKVICAFGVKNTHIIT